MKKIKTLKMNYEFKNVFTKGKYFVGKQVIIYFLKNKYNYNRYGIAISSKLAKAVKRNKAKRVIRACFQQLFDYNLKNNTSTDIVFIWNKKANILDVSYKIILEDMKKAFIKFNIIETI